MEGLHNSPNQEQKYLEGKTEGDLKCLKEIKRNMSAVCTCRGVVGASEVSVVEGFWDSSSCNLQVTGASSQPLILFCYLYCPLALVGICCGQSK